MSRGAIAEEAIDRTAGEPDSAGPDAFPDSVRKGGSYELLALALPLVVSQSFMTVQVFVDTILLSWHDQKEMAATLPAILWYWLPFGLLQVTAGYVSTFVAQYTGARPPGTGRPRRLARNSLFRPGRAAVPSYGTGRDDLVALAGHTEALQALEATYLRCLSFAALPMLVMAAVNGFFSGRGQTWTVLGIEAAGTAFNVALALVLIFGRAGFPELGIAGAGLGHRGGLVDVRRGRAGPVFQAKYRAGIQYPARLAAGARPLPPPDEVWRTRRCAGVPRRARLPLLLPVVGRLGEAATAATTLTVRLNMVAFLPMMGLGQAVSILVGQRLGQTGQTWPNGQPIPASSGCSATCARWPPFMCCSPACSSALFEGIATRKASPPWPRLSLACSSAWPSTPWPTRSM